MRRFRVAVLAALSSLALAVAPLQAHAATDPEVSAQPTADTELPQAQSSSGTLRVATVSAGLSESSEGALAKRLSGGQDQAAQRLASNIQTTRPDVVLVTNIDTDSDAPDSFNENYLQKAQQDRTAINYPYVYAADTNAGVQSGADLNGNGSTGDSGDAFGFGEFEGQRSMVMYSRYPIDEDQARTFNNLLWDELPGNHIAEKQYSKLVRSVMPLNSTSVWDVPVKVDGRSVHVVGTALTPDSGVAADPVRRQDQLRFLNMYVNNDPALGQLSDDAGDKGGLNKDEDAVVVGALGRGTKAAEKPVQNEQQASSEELEGLLESPNVRSLTPTWDNRQCPVKRAGDPQATLTDVVCASNQSTRLSNTYGRYDYVLPSATLNITGSGLAPGTADQETAEGPSQGPEDTTRMVWANVEVPAKK